MPTRTAENERDGMSEQTLLPPATETQPLTRVRVTYGKVDSMRYVGNLDMHTVWERTLRRAELPVAYSKSFHPRPRFQMAASLPLGATSQCELLDIWLVQPPALEEIHRRLARCAPPGLLIVAVEAAGLQEPAMQTRILASEYEVVLQDAPPQAELEQRIAGLLAVDSLPRQWRGRPYDLRPLIEQLGMQPDGSATLFVRLSAREGANGRPEEVLAALGLDPLSGRIRRTRLIFS
jgi:radical SAM-linked protein